MKANTLRASDLRFLLALLLPALTLHSVSHRPQTAGLVAFGVLFLIAALEALLPALARSPAPHADGGTLRWVLRLFVPLELALLSAGATAAVNASWPTLVGVGIAVGFVTGAQGITFAHELGHSRQRADRALAWVLMTPVGYPQFMVEHFRGHHVRAATPADPASARPGESLWAFLPRTLAGSLRSAWELEAAHLQRRRRGWAASPLPWASGASVAWLLALAVAGQWKLLAFWLVQSAFAVWLLETVNYIEHYGLQRRLQADGRPEPFGVAHAWNADHVVSNSLLANLQRHSDHHVHAWKPFGQLEPLPGPQLPTGYAGCILLAAVPPLWFLVMEPRRAGAAAPG
ncbi:alkane 1-monooxygenase [Ramlibacter alkalitolerans]|jgi:alkane 1-monooxygenase|uniref:Alkane 1-monooxygenase n=1 Tax=Ramlibacter alkalitolerans TaxID=2039631 RepID=A0ABS1JTI6_9BURK|nr:alkane 1-monooxygenase [Ramlibacter alkalitolerans]MBL0427533.1 alkane 1-monooxygenase [Ramlibacter alkalitolerans]